MKTGSSSIQGWLSRERQRLAQEGVYVPFGNLSYFGTMSQFPNRERHAGSMERLRHLGGLIDALPPQLHTVVLSGEGMGQLLHSRKQVALLKSLLDPHFDSYTVIVYLRRQDQASVSHSAYSIRRGHKTRDLLAKPINYANLLDAWSHAFGAENIRPRVFERSALVDGDAVADFAQTAELGPMGEPLTRGDINPSNTPAAQALLRGIFDAIERDTDLKAHQFTSTHGFKSFLVTLDREFAGTGRLPTRDEAIAFYETCKADNEKVRAQWFPERKTLFTEDFDRYPVEPQPGPSGEEVAHVAGAVLSKLLLSPVWEGSKNLQPRLTKEGRLAKRARRAEEGAAVGEEGAATAATGPGGRIVVRRPVDRPRREERRAAVAVARAKALAATSEAELDDDFDPDAES